MKKILLPVLAAFSLSAGAQNVGIGTSTPAFKLQVTDSVDNASLGIYTPTASFGDQSILQLHAGDNPFNFLQISNFKTGSGGTTFAGLPSNGLSVIHTGGSSGPLLFLGGNDNSPLVFATSYGQQMRITAPGNIGMGTAFPSAKLHVTDSVNGTRVIFQSPVAGESARLDMIAGTNIFNNLAITKYQPGTLGTLAGLPKDNLAVIGTGGNAGTLLIDNGNGSSPIVFSAGTGEIMRITADDKVAIGTTTPAAKLHVHEGVTGSDVSIMLTNSTTGTNPLRGARLRMLNSDFSLYNYEATGKMHFYTGFTSRMTISEEGNIGIGTMTPTRKLEIVGNGTTPGIYVNHSGNTTAGITSLISNANTIGVATQNYHNVSGSEYGIGVWAVSGQGSGSISPSNNYGVIGESRNTANGIGIMGISNAPSGPVIDAGVVGFNFSTQPFSYGIIGSTSSNTGAGTVGKTTNGSAGLLGIAFASSTGSAIKATSQTGSSQINLELDNGAIKVSGANRTVFQHAATAGNTSFNETIIPNTTLANSPTDLLIVTPYWDGVYVNAPIGVYYALGQWRIFRQDSGTMPVGAKFNVLVVKQ